MDQLRAITTDLEPFPPPLGFRGNFFAILPCTTYRCPYCRWVFKVTWGPSNASVGTGERVCWHCKQRFHGGSSEWPAMSNGDRLKFFLPMAVAGFFACFLVVFGMYLSRFFSAGQHFNPGDAIFFVTFFFPIGCWSAFRFLQIVRSYRRYNRRSSRTPA